MKFATEQKIVVRGYAPSDSSKLYKLSSPLKGHHYIAVVAHRSQYFGDNTMVFPTDENGRITFYAPLIEVPILIEATKLLKRLGYQTHEIFDRSILNQKWKWN